MRISLHHHHPSSQLIIDLTQLFIRQVRLSRSALVITMASDNELIILASAGAIAIYAGKQGPKCPFHRSLFVLSTASFAATGLTLLWRIIAKRTQGGGSKKDAKGVLALVRKNILELEPYRCARDDYSEGILLDANENSFGSALPPADQAQKLERYPDPYQQELKEKIGKYR